MNMQTVAELREILKDISTENLSAVAAFASPEGREAVRQELEGRALEPGRYEVRPYMDHWGVWNTRNDGWANRGPLLEEEAHTLAREWNRAYR